MHDILDTLETLGTALMHTLFTAFSWGCAHWNAAGAAILMLMQGIYLYKKIKEKK